VSTPVRRFRLLRGLHFGLSFSLALGFCGLFLNACAVRRHVSEVQPLVPPAPAYGQSALSAGISASTQPWWRTFNDPLLDQLVTAALRTNLGLMELSARVEQADALLRQARGRLFPALNANGTVEAQQVTDANATFAGDETAFVGGTLSWELDVWGRLRAAREGRRHERIAVAHDWLGGRLLLSALVAETYFEMLEQQEQIRLAHEQIAVNETLLDLTKLRFGQGQSSIVDVLQQQEQLASTRSRLPEIESRFQQLAYALDVLLAGAPGTRAQEVRGELKEPPAFPRGGVPSDLLVHRPDLVAARHLVAAADSEVAEAMADRLPRFMIGGSAAGIGDLTPNALVTSAFASLAGPIFDAGTRKAEVDLRRAAVRERLARFSGAYLVAVQEVETAFMQEQKQAERVRLLAEQLTVAQRLLRETRNRYSQGLTDYLPVLNAVVTEQNLQRQILASRRQWLGRRVALHRALGGPMEAEAPVL
jgi:NodT family efflux transporter outer membrane factor (OMF) lipoprotein